MQPEGRGKQRERENRGKNTGDTERTQEGLEIKTYDTTKHRTMIRTVPSFENTHKNPENICSKRSNCNNCSILHVVFKPFFSKQMLMGEPKHPRRKPVQIPG